MTEGGGRRIAISRRIAAPPGVVWRLIAEFRHWPHWGPTVRDVTSEASEVAAGVTGEVLAPLGIRLPFVITEVVPGRSWEWDVAGRRATGHAVVPAENGTSLVEFSVHWLLAPYCAVLYLGLRRLAALAESDCGSPPH